MHMCKRMICLLLCFVLLSSYPLTALAQSQPDQVRIDNVEEFLSFAQNCIFDSYSQGMTVYLECDLDLSGIDFRGIPTFGGTFEGQGHRITGLELTESGSAVGLFRYVQTTGIVRDLQVSGHVAPGGTASIVGGIAGSNRGLLINCSFEGSIAGKSTVGAIAGVNGENGVILNCASHGVVVGENMTGGVTGYNMGLLEQCSNRACVNIYTPDSSLNLGNIDLSVLMDPESLSAGITVMDTGGIAGYSVGAIYDCHNTASVGYPHIGYNVGGVVGRSSGTVSGCTNAAEIQGRKEVGGIVGQMEPNVSLKLSEDYVQTLELQLGELKVLAQELQGSFEQLGAVNTHLNNVLDHVDGTSGSLEDLAGYIADYGNGMTDEFNRVGLILDEVLEQMIPVLEQAAAFTDSLATSMDQLAAAIDKFADAANYLELSIYRLNGATADLKAAGASASQAMESITQALESFAGILQVSDPAQLQQALDQLQAGVGQLSTAAKQAKDAAQTIAGVMQQEGTWNDETQAAFQGLAGSMDTLSAALQSMYDGAVLLSGSIGIGSPDFYAGIDSMKAGMASLCAAGKYLPAAMEDLSLALSAMEKTAELGGDGLEILSGAMEEFGNSFRILTQISQSLQALLERISRYEPIQLPYLDSGASDAVDQIFMNINGISDELRSILQISDQFSAEVTQRFNALTDKFSQVIATALKLVDQVKEDAANGLISDTSEVDIDAVKAGKVSACVNSGSIHGDINVGGITGAMAIEYQLDPEDDISGELSNWQRRTYQAKAIVQNCTNMGVISGKRNCIGGICGKMDMGIILQSGSYGDVSSSDGDFVGGIAGAASSVIRQCSVKASLTGRNYVGGVAGRGVRVSDCYVMADPSGSEKVGSILGHAEEVSAELISRNYYFAMPGAPGAIDGISYDGCAQTEDFLEMEGLDARFPEAVLTFCYENGESDVLRLAVGTVLEETMIPTLENEDGQIFFWKNLDQFLGKPQYFDRVFIVEQKNMTTVLESVQTRPDGKPILLLQGAFLTDEPVQLQPVSELEEALEGWRFAVPQGGVVTRIRYACPEGQNADGLEIVVQDSTGAYHSVPFAVSGSYLVFDVEEGITQFYVRQTSDDGIPAAYLWGGAIALLILAGAVILFLIRKKNGIRLGKKRKHTPRETK